MVPCIETIVHCSALYYKSMYILQIMFCFCIVFETSLMRRLQLQTLPDATPPMGKIHPFSKIAVTFEPLMRFRKFFISMT